MLRLRSIGAIGMISFCAAVGVCGSALAAAPQASQFTQTLVENQLVSASSISRQQYLQLAQQAKAGGGIMLGAPAAGSLANQLVGAVARPDAASGGCWQAQTRSGASDPTGHAWIYQNIAWCGYFGIITSASLSQTYSQAGFYAITGMFGPYWGTNPVGATQSTAHGYIFWSYDAPWPFSNNGTSYLNTTVYGTGSETQ